MEACNRLVVHATNDTFKECNHEKLYFLLSRSLCGTPIRMTPENRGTFRLSRGVSSINVLYDMYYLDHHAACEAEYRVPQDRGVCPSFRSPSVRWRILPSLNLPYSWALPLGYAVGEEEIYAKERLFDGAFRTQCHVSLHGSDGGMRTKWFFLTRVYS